MDAVPAAQRRVGLACAAGKGANRCAPLGTARTLFDMSPVRQRGTLPVAAPLGCLVVFSFPPLD
jgi:hypothetical protein